MTKVMQNVKGDDGDCLRACVASLLDMNLNDVPDFVNAFSNWFDAIWYWFRFRGYKLRYKGANPPNNSKFLDILNQHVGIDNYVIVTVDSLRDGCDHVCIYSTKEKRIVHDPNEGSPCVRIQPPILGYYELVVK